MQLSRASRRQRPTLRRSVAVLGVLAVAGGLIAAAPAAQAKPAPPPNPTNGQISAAQNRKTSLANQVGVLSGQIASAQAELNRLQGAKELAEQKVAFAISKQRTAEYNAGLARAALKASGVTLTTARDRFTRSLQASYISGQPGGSISVLLTAKNPTLLLESSTLQRYVDSSQLSAINGLQRATVAHSNREARSRAAVAALKVATANAKSALSAARNAVSAQAAQEASLQSTLATNQAALSSAQLALATLNNQRTTFLAYQAEQARLARIRAAKLAAARRAAAAAAARARAAAAAAARRSHHSGGGGGGGSSRAVSYSPPPRAVGGRWTAARGRAAVHRAMTTLGMPYAWAGGGAGGPTYGVCDASNGAPNDCNVDGYDCSGLAMYAWGPYLSMDHYAASQYSQAGSYHPSLSHLRPGDLLFWSSDGTVGGIHHVAIYKGNGQIIQAPFSGGYVEVSSMYDPGTIFGATRPLT